MALPFPGPTSAPMTLEEWAITLNRNITDFFRYIYEPAAAEYPKLAKELSTSMWYQLFAGAQGIAKPIPNRDLNPIPLRSPVRSNTSKSTQVEYRSGIVVERLMFEAPMPGNTAPMDNMRDFIESEKTLRDQVVANVYNNGFSVQDYDFTEFGGSQVALFSTAHNYEDGNGTYSNYLNMAVPPNLASLYQIMATMRRYTDNVGNYINMMTRFTMLIPSLKPDWWQAAAQICLSPDNPETADRAVNTLNKDFNIGYEVINNFTSDSKWFVRTEIGQRYFPILMPVFYPPNMSPLQQINGLNVDAWGARLRSIFSVALFGSARGVFAVGV